MNPAFLLPNLPADPPLQITAPQNEGLAPKAFQTSLVDGVCTALAAEPRPPCLLRSPTGSGKTFMLTRILQRVSERSPVLWLWFVPYVNLVAQTVDTLDSQASETALVAKHLLLAQNEAPAAGLVLVSTVQGVASAKGRKAGYDDKGDDAHRSLAAYFALARARGLEIGLVVDEAHIALDSATEFGQFVRWLRADYLLMASATPKDARLNEFIAGAGNIAFKAFSVSRADVVAERLNKPWLQAVVYNLRESMQGVTDLKLTVLRRAWLQNRHIGQMLRARGLATVPLMLVQVANGDEAMKEAVQFLTQPTPQGQGIAAHAIGMHSAAEPDPVLMAAIAVDATKEVLVFKQSAGTGFDAPRAFVLASTKPVNDEDFAMQFIGRVMRVPGELQRAYPVAYTAPDDLDTAYIFLANSQAQAGFAQAVNSTKGVLTMLEGQTEELVARPTVQGGVALTNRPTPQTPLAYDIGALPTVGMDGVLRQPPVTEVIDEEASGYLPAAPEALPGETSPLFGSLGMADELDGLDRLIAANGHDRRPATPRTRSELISAFDAYGLRVIPRLTRVAQHPTPERLTTEVKPAFDVLALDMREAARQLPLSEEIKGLALRAALHLLTEIELRTELFSGESNEQQVQVITDRDALMERTEHALNEMGLEEQDHLDLIGELARRLMPEIERAHAYRDDTTRAPALALLAQARDAACWVIHKQRPELQEALHRQWASKAREDSAAPLPELLLAPASLALNSARKNIYGVMFPDTEAVTQHACALPTGAARWFRNETYVLPGTPEDMPDPQLLTVGRLDATYEFNGQELAFARALERADFVAWWHRNPQGKPYSVALMRSDSRHLFYPDFVVCLHHDPGALPLMRLVETKHDVKDASRKAQHYSKTYGKVLFMTKDAQRFKIVEDDGRLGDVVDFDDLARLREWMRAFAPGR